MMKPNLPYIFDKITATQDDGRVRTWRSEDRLSLMERVQAIGLSDRGVAINELETNQLADALIAARDADRETLLRIRASLVRTSPER